tara:strand:- start:91 stop:843 length:753 start_codon:yes stop_codon:yes gene_type:complete
MTAAANIKTWAVLGGSSSIGRAFAATAAAAGSNVVLAGRDLEDLERTAADIQIRFGVTGDCARFDALDTGSHDALCEMLAERGGPVGIFLLFGFMPEQAEIDDDRQLGRQTIDVNYTGAVSILSRLAPLLGERPGSRAIVLSSVSGDRGRLKNYVYGSAKAGLNAYLQGLRARLYRSGSFVTTVKAGFIDTDMTFGATGLFLVATPTACAEACWALGLKGREVAYFPWFWRYIMLIIKTIPERIFKKMSI